MCRESGITCGLITIATKSTEAVHLVLERIIVIDDNQLEASLGSSRPLVGRIPSSDKPSSQFEGSSMGSSAPSIDDFTELIDEADNAVLFITEFRKTSRDDIELRDAVYVLTGITGVIAACPKGDLLEFNRVRKIVSQLEQLLVDVLGDEGAQWMVSSRRIRYVSNFLGDLMDDADRRESVHRWFEWLTGAPHETDILLGRVQLELPQIKVELGQAPAPTHGAFG